jgi:Sporulation and spore germination
MSRDEEILRRALEAEAGRVEVSADALSVIRRRVAARRGWRRLLAPPRQVSLAFGAGVALAGAAAIVAVVILVGSLPWGRAPNPPLATGGSPATPSVLVSADEALTVPPGSLAIYYLGATRNGPLLYREFHPGVPNDGSPAGRAKAALIEMLERPALDPDYTSHWPGRVTVRSVSIDDDTVTADLAGVDLGKAMDPKVAEVTIQQLVWTVTAARPGLTGVRLLFDGKPATSVWGTPVGGVLRRGRAADVRAPVWLIDPQEGATVGRTFTVYVSGVAAGATVRVRIRSDSVLLGPQTVKLGDDAYASAKVSFTTVDPGRYTAEAFISSPTDRSEQFVDDHEFTVQ